MTSPAPKLLNPNILALLLTREDVDFLHAEAEKMQRSLFSVGHNWLSYQKELSRKNAAIFEEIFPNKEKEWSLDEIKETLFLLQREIHSLPVMKITLAFSPSGEVVEELSRFAREKFDPFAVLLIETDAAILGGAIVSFGGKYFDHSLRRQLQEQWPVLKEQLRGELAAREVGSGKLEAGT